MAEIKVGTKIRFTKKLMEGPTGDHPTFLYAEKGEEGVITQVGGCREGYWARTRRNPPFGVRREEFEVIEE